MLVGLSQAHPQYRAVINHVLCMRRFQLRDYYLTFQPFTLHFHFILPAAPRLAVTIPIVGRRANSTAINTKVSRQPRSG